MNRWIDDTTAEIVRQEAKYGTFGSRMFVGQVRLGIAVLQDEVKEVLDAWWEDRKTGVWDHTAEELLQAAAVAIRLREYVLSRKEE